MTHKSQICFSVVPVLDSNPFCHPYPPRPSMFSYQISVGHPCLNAQVNPTMVISSVKKSIRSFVIFSFFVIQPRQPHQSVPHYGDFTRRSKIS